MGPDQVFYLALPSRSHNPGVGSWCPECRGRAYLTPATALDRCRPARVSDVPSDLAVTRKVSRRAHRSHSVALTALALQGTDKSGDGFEHDSVRGVCRRQGGPAPLVTDAVRPNGVGCRLP